MNISYKRKQLQKQSVNNSPQDLLNVHNIRNIMRNIVYNVDVSTLCKKGRCKFGTMQGKSTLRIVVLLLFTAYPYSLCTPSQSDTADIMEGQNTIDSNSTKFAVVGYLPEWRYGGVDWEAISDHLTHLIFFSIEVDKQSSFAAMDR